MRILSFDVGIKNLAYCLLKSENNYYTIEEWNIINLCNQNNYPCKICMKNAKYKKDNDYYCSLHAKKSDYKIPTTMDSINKIKKLKLTDLITKADDYDISFNKCLYKNKCKIIDLIEENLNNKYLNIIQEEKTNDYNLIELGINLKAQFDEKYKHNLSQIDVVIIENQISPIANRMKTLQGMIAQYFIIHNINKIEFISSTNKLKLFIGNKNTTYNERKKLATSICNDLLIKNKSEWVNFFNKNKKKDNLADCFLQGRWYLKNSILK